jgi:hypothetical protein
MMLSGKLLLGQAVMVKTTEAEKNMAWEVGWGWIGWGWIWPVHGLGLVLC